MKRRGLLILIALTCLAPAAAAQVSGNATPSAGRDTTADSAPMPPTYPPPPEILGPGPGTQASSSAIRNGSSPVISDGSSRVVRDGVQSSSTGRDRAQTLTAARDGADVPQPLAAPAAVAASRTTPSAPPEQSPAQPCRGSNGSPQATGLPARQSQFPGVSASQFQRAGVGTDAFTRPGVGTEQLRALVPGSGAGSCSSGRAAELYPEPATPRLAIPTRPDEQDR